MNDKSLLKDYTIQKAFTLDFLKNGVNVKPDGKMTIRVQVDAKLLKKDVKAILIDKDGNVSELPTRKGKDYIEFDTSRNGTFALLSKDTATINNNTDTADHTHAGLLFGFLLLSAGAIVVLMKKRKA